MPPSGRFRAERRDARAARRPADEPEVDAARDQPLDPVVAAARARGTAVLVVTHDEQVARRMDRILHLRGGQIAEEATRTGRYAVIGADGAVHLPDEALTGAWAPGALVVVAQVGPDELRIRPARPP